MENEIKSSIENDDLSLPKSVEVDKIIEFYKDIDDSEENFEHISEETTKHRKFKNFFKKKAADDGIETEVYGLSEKGRIYLYRGISALISVFIIIGAFVLAYFLPGNKEIIAEKQNTLRAEEGYKQLKSRHTALKNEVEELKTSNKAKKETIDKLADPENTKAELRTEITAKKYELSELNGQVQTKETELETLNTTILEKAPPETILPPGNYVAGKNIAAGKYNVTGTGKFMVASSAGKSKINTTLGSTPLDIVLEENDVIKFDSKVKFISSN